MKYFIVFFFFLSSIKIIAQETPTIQISGIIVSNSTGLPLSNSNVININKVKGTSTNNNGRFEIEATANDTLHISLLGFQSIKVRVTNDWIKNKITKIELTEKAIALEEVIIGNRYNLTGYLEIDTKIIPEKENYRYNILGLSQGYEAGEYAPSAFGNVLNSISKPADALYNFFGKKPKELKRLKEMKKDDTVRKVLENKYDREMAASLLGIDKREIPDILKRCNYSDPFIESANDLQIMDAINGCYEEYKILKKSK